MADYHMEVVLLHGGGPAVGAWQRSDAVAVVLIAAQLSEPDAGRGLRSHFQSQTRVTCLLAQVDLATGAASCYARAHRPLQKCMYSICCTITKLNIARLGEPHTACNLMTLDGHSQIDAQLTLVCAASLTAVVMVTQVMGSC